LIQGAGGGRPWSAGSGRARALELRRPRGWTCGRAIPAVRRKAACLDLRRSASTPVVARLRPMNARKTASR
jgi:hypothetical protein